MGKRILIKNGLLVLSDRVFAGDLLVEGEKIAAISQPGVNLEAEQTIDVNGAYILPGLLDPHVHLTYGRNPEDFDSETAAAAMGGVTSVLSYNWVLDDFNDWFSENKTLGEKLSHIDFGFQFGLMGEHHIKNISKFKTDFGVSSYKFYMQYMNNPGRKKGINLNYADMYQAFLAIADKPGTMICIHCEDPDIIERTSAKVHGIEDPKAWLDSRPSITEARGVQTALDLAALTGAPCYLVHISSKESVELIKEYRQSGNKPMVWVETCPHYLTLTYKDIRGSLGKVNPPIRTAEDNESLWQAIEEGIVDTIGSDHIARSTQDKSGGLWSAKAGFPGSYAILPVLFTEGHLKRKLPLPRIAELTSTNAARIFNLYPKKGTLQPGSDADLVVLNPSIEKSFSAKDLPSGSDFCLYEGRSMSGWPSLVMVRGRAVVEGGHFIGAPGYGKYLNRT